MRYLVREKYCASNKAQLAFEAYLSSPMYIVSDKGIILLKGKGDKFDIYNYPDDPVSKCMPNNSTPIMGHRILNLFEMNTDYIVGAYFSGGIKLSDSMDMFIVRLERNRQGQLIMHEIYFNSWKSKSKKAVLTKGDLNKLYPLHNNNNNNNFNDVTKYIIHSSDGLIYAHNDRDNIYVDDFHNRLIFNSSYSKNLPFYQALNYECNSYYSLTYKNRNYELKRFEIYTRPDNKYQYITYNCDIKIEEKFPLNYLPDMQEYLGSSNYDIHNKQLVKYLRSVEPMLE
jgi:hypothetical protein